MTTVENPAVLREMNPTRALAYCAYITREEWEQMESKDVIDLWIVFRSYIHHGYCELDIQVPTKISDAWLRCKHIIDMEVEMKDLKEAVNGIQDVEDISSETDVEEDASFVDVEESGHGA